MLSKVEDKDGKTGGWWMGGVPPHGYDLRYESITGEFLFVVRYMPDGSKQLYDEDSKLTRTLARGESLSISKRDRCKLVPGSPERIKVIQYIYRMYTEQGKGFGSIAATLNLEEIPTARGPAWSYIYSGHWAETTVRSMLINPIYAGDMVWNRRTDARFHQIRGGQAVERESVHGARLVLNDESDWIVIRDAHPALVSRRVFNLAKDKRESQPTSIEQRGHDPRLKMHGKTWQGKRSRFILSGLMTCVLCGNRYQGVTRRKSKRRMDGTSTVTFSYGCGGHIVSGNGVCRMNAILQDTLEGVVIDTVLNYYAPYLAKDGRRLMSEAVKQQMDCEGEDLAAARERAEEERNRVAGIIDNLLDNLTSTNREFVDDRLKQLTSQRERLENRLEELDHLATSQAEISTVVSDALQFISGLKFTLRQGLPQEKLVALRQCIKRVHIDKPGKLVTIRMRDVPSGDLQAVSTITVELPIEEVETSETPEPHSAA